jgi:protein-disulfide isomerase
MSNQKKKGSAMPLVIIVVVLILAVGGFYFLYSTSKSPNTTGVNGKTPTPPNANRTPITAPANAPPGSAPVYALGDPTASVTIEEFADFQCPSCAVAHPVMKDVQSAFAGNKNVRFIFRHYPLPIHDKSYDAATVVEAAGMQGKFWPMMDQLMSNQQAWANNSNYRELWKEYAGKIGLDVDRWQTDAAGLATKGRIDRDIERARGIGVNSTPSVYINNRLIPFADLNAPTMRQLIEAELQNAPRASTNAAPVNAPAANQANTAK